MKASERDLLLGRVEEKTESIIREIVDLKEIDLKEIKEYNKTQNGHIADIIKNFSAKHGDVNKAMAHNSAWISAFKWIVIVGASLLGTHLGGLW